jgi:hypothetical protein
MPALFITGVVKFAVTLPASCAIPVSAGETTCAFTVMVTCPPAIRCGAQVPAHCPAPMGAKASSGSPEENVASTDPAIIGAPQLSTTFTCKGAGQAAGV